MRAGSGHLYQFEISRIEDNNVLMGLAIKATRLHASVKQLPDIMCNLKGNWLFQCVVMHLLYIMDGT